MKKSKKIALLSAAFVAVVALLIFGPAFANDSEQARRDIFYAGDHICVAVDSVDGSSVALECFCPCGELCAEPSEEPTETPTPPVPEPTDKPKCNSGRGNGSEGDPDCDPGNSGGHNQGGD